MTARPVYINGRFLTQAVTGVQRYAREIVTAIDAQLASADDGLDWRVLTPPGAAPLPLRRIATEPCGRLSGHGWDQVSFARRARGGVALSLAMSGPLFHPRHLAVIHDVAVFRHPEHFSRAYRTAHQVIERTLSRTAHLATVSHFSQREIAAVLGVAAERILVAPNGVEHMASAADTAAVDRLALRGRPYFVMIGSLAPNKNLATALRALERLPRGAARLVMVGGMNNRVFGDAAATGGEDVVMAGRLSDAEMTGLLQHATALLFPSIYEGFGIPPLEAMVNGCPVLASNAGAPREVCGEAAEFFDATDDVALAALMTQVLRDDGSWRAARVAAGRARVARYSWATSAATIAEACRRLAAG